MVDLANVWARDFNTAGIPSSGKKKPEKSNIREWGTFIESLTMAASYGNTVWFATKALLTADLAHAAGVPAIVYADTTAANNGIYIKAGASGAGSWGQIITYLPGYQFVTATDAGAGTANAIVATSSPRVAYTDGVQLIRLNIFETNTSGTVTVAFDGGAALTIQTAAGNAPAVGGLVAGMTVLGVVDQTASVFRMLSDQSGAAIQAAAEAAQAYSEEWANKAEDSLVSTAAGGDGTSEYSARHWAAKAATSTPANFTQTGTGAVTVTAQVKMEQTVSAFDFLTETQRAAVGSGSLVAGLAGALQKAIAASVGSNGRKLIINKGLWKLDPAESGAGAIYPGSGAETTPADFGIWINGVFNIEGEGSDLTTLQNVGVTPGYRFMRTWYNPGTLKGFKIDQNSVASDALLFNSQGGYGHDIKIYNIPVGGRGYVVEQATGSVHRDIEIGISYGTAAAFINMPYPKTDNLKVEVYGGTGLSISACHAMDLAHTYLDVNSGAITKLLSVEGGCSAINFDGFYGEIAGGTSIAGSIWMALDDVQGGGIKGFRINHNGGPDGTIVAALLGTTKNFFLEDGYYNTDRLSTAFFDGGREATVRHTGIKNARITSSAGVLTGVTTSAAIVGFTIEDIDTSDSAFAVSHNISGTELSLKNVSQATAFGAGSKGSAINCSGAFTGAGANGVVKLDNAAAKLLVAVSGVGTRSVTKSLGAVSVASITGVTGEYTLNLDASFSDADWIHEVSLGATGDSGQNDLIATVFGKTASSITIRVYDVSTGVLADTNRIQVVGYGDLA